LIHHKNRVRIYGKPFSRCVKLTKAINVLIVDSEPMVVDIMREFIGKTGEFVVVGSADTGETALELVTRFCPALMLLEVCLPDMSGLAVVQTIRRQNLPTDSIFITVMQDAHTVENALRCGALDYLVKPVRFSRFNAALMRFTARYHILNSQQILDKNDIDRLWNWSGERDWLDEIPKGLNRQTLKMVHANLSECKEALSAEKVASRLGLARVTARRYLEYMEVSGMVGVELQYGSVGRPIKKYRFQSNY
jgi:two-component system response regulator DctR